VRTAYAARVRRFRLPIGRIFGIQLYLHGTWFVVLALVVWASARVFAQAYPGLPAAERSAMAIVTGPVFFACLALHEVSHAVVARRFGIAVHGITLFLFGGVAEIDGEVPSPGREFAVALVGPATSVALASLFALAAMGATALHRAGAEGVLLTLAAVNLGVAVFNLIPGLPLDGGRLLRAGVWGWTGDFTRATRIAAVGGQILAVCLAVLGAVVVLTGDLAGLWYVPLGAFVWFLARRSALARVPVPMGALALPREGDPAQSRP
jgi:Zn-dependent protease